MKTVELLTDIKLAKPQSAGNMIVIPLISDYQDLSFSEDMLFVIKNDNDYSTLTLRNEDDKKTIIPQGIAYITKQSAQDRTVINTDIIDAKQDKIINVGCVQSSQGGHMDVGTNEFTFMPATIRECALSTKKSHSYSILWDDITKYLNNIKVGHGRAHIADFFESVKKELEEFIAPFEMVKNQRGAIIFINNKFAGIELYPNYKTWQKVWKRLLRDSYGSDAIGLIKKKNVIAYKPILDVDKINDLDSLRAEVVNVVEKHIAFSKKLVSEDILDKEVVTTNKNEVGDSIIKNLEVGRNYGQAVVSNGKTAYVTVVARSL